MTHDLTDDEILATWFENTDWTRERLIAELERTDRGDGIPGVDAGLLLEITSTIPNQAWKVAVARAVQSLAIRKSWRDEPTRKEPEETQLGMFD